MLTPDDIQTLGQIPPATVTDLPLPPGDDSEAGVWKNMINCRLRVDGNYLLLTPRGGSELVAGFASPILTIYPFATSINGVDKSFVAVHTANGNAALYDVGAATTTTIFTGVFRSAGQVQFVHNGLFVYVFDSAENVYKVWDITAGIGYDWLGQTGKSLSTFSWLTGNWTQKNMWPVEEGARIVVFHKFHGGKYLDPETGKDSFRAFVTRVESVFNQSFHYLAPDQRSFSSQSYASNLGFAPATADIIAGFDRAVSSLQVNDNGVVESNLAFVEPLIWKSYLILDLLGDGSFLPPGRPLIVSTPLGTLNSSRRLGVEIDLPTPAPGVSKRFLYASRWQVSEANAHDPNRPEYPNSPYFLVKPVEISQSSVKDITPDNQLLTPLSERYPITAGVSQLFGRGQLSPATVAVQRQTLLLGGYTISRPTPVIYTDPANPAAGNSFYNQAGAGLNLTGDPELAVQFEYPDGKVSEIVDSGQILSDGEETVVPSTSSIQATLSIMVSNPTGSGQMEIRIESTGSPILVNYLGSDSETDFAQKIINDVNASPLATYMTASSVPPPSPGFAGVKFTWDTAGDAGNNESLRFLYSNTVTVDNDFSGLVTKSFSGGFEGTTAIVASANRLRFHSLNALVSAIHVLVKVGLDYKLIEAINPTDPGFHGARLFLPNTDAEITALPAYNVPPASQHLATVDLQGSIVPAVPFGEPRIGEQKSLDGSVKIGRLVPWRFDDDKAGGLLFRILAFTDQNIQMGYLSFGSGESFSLTADFEVILAGMRAVSFDCIRKIGGAVFFPGNQFFYMWAGSEPTALFDVNRYPVSANNNPIDVVFNSDQNEVWIIYGTQRVVSIGLNDRSLRRMDYTDLGSLTAAGFFSQNVYIASGGNLYRTDRADQSTDGAALTPIQAILESHHIGNRRMKSRILEVNISGQSGSVSLDVDLQPARREGSADPWDSQFDPDVSFPEKNLNVQGASFDVYRRAVMPRLRLQFQEGAVEDIFLRQVITENQGKSRQL